MYCSRVEQEMQVEIREALAELGVTGDPSPETLTEAATEAWRRRHVNTDAGAAVIRGMLDAGMSYRAIQDATGIPPGTAHRWARPPGEDER